MLDLIRDTNTILHLHKHLGSAYSGDISFLLNTLREFDKYPRCYHSSDHIIDLCTKVIADKHEPKKERLLLLTAVYHDYVYDPKSKTNEEDSAKKFLDDCSFLNVSAKDTQLIYSTILDTKTHAVYSSAFSKEFCKYDLSSFKGSDLDRIAIEAKIRKEYEWVEWNDYRKNKLEFLDKYRKIPIAQEDPEILEGMNFLAFHIKTETPPTNIGVYAGSFDPFHVGHQNILEKAEKIFGKVIIAVGKNPDKNGKFERNWQDVEALKYRQVDLYNTSLPEYFNTKPYKPTLIRGLRNSIDLQTEIVQTRWLQELDPDIKIVNIVCDKEFDHISSSGIRNTVGFRGNLGALAESYKVK